MGRRITVRAGLAVGSALLTLIVAGMVSPSLSAEQGVKAAICFWSVQGPIRCGCSGRKMMFRANQLVA